MAGSRRSPVLRDQWRGAGDDHRGREKHRPRGSHRDRGRDRFRDRDRRPPPRDTRPDHSSRSPPPRSFSQTDNEPQHREYPPNIASSRGSPGLPHSEIHSGRNPNRFHSPDTDHRGPESHVRTIDKDHRREDSPSAPPPSKRKRTRSPSPGIHRGHPPPPHRRPPSKQGNDFDRSFPRGRGRGRPSGRGRGGRRLSPRRGRDRRRNEGGRRDSSRSRHPTPPEWRGEPYTHSNPNLHSPGPEGYIEERTHHRSASRHSAGSMDSRYSKFSQREPRRDPTMYPPRRAQPSVGDSHRSLSPSRPILNADADTASVSADTGGFYGRGSQRRRPSQSHADARQYSTTMSPQYVTPAYSHHGSPHSNSPYSAGRGGRSGQQPPYHGQDGQDKTSAKDTANQHYHGQTPVNPSSGHTAPSYSYRDGQSGYRENHHARGMDRRFSASGPTGHPSHGRGRFRSPQWDASDARSRAGPSSPPSYAPPPPQSPPPPPPSEHPSRGDTYESDANHRPTSKDSREGDQVSKHQPESGISQTMQSDVRPSDKSATPNKGGKISFAFKAKTGPPSAPKPVPDLAQRMLAREPPPRVAEPPRTRMTAGPPPRFKPEPRFDRRDRDRDRHRDRDRNRNRNDRRDFREPRGFREPRDGRDNRRDDRRFDPRHERKRNDRNHDFRPERQERSPEPVKRPKIMLRPKPRPTISDEFKNSDSVYYRKPGNESVIGAGTYGKVFKAIHVYTQRKVALKKIRMEGEKDGFPVTAVREIKLLQHLRNHNVVSLLEVMVEKNECFMVFEYLSHDLTGLINHPTFTLTAAHKKDLAKQMFEGLNYLHHRGVLHRDIKAANILISNRGQLKFADFGLARFFSKSRQLDYTNRVITIWYRPPELLLGETRYGPAVDVWSAACVYVEMFTKKAVFPGEGGEISQLDKLYNTLGTPTRADWPDVVEMPWFELMRPTGRRKRIFEEVYREILSPAALDFVSQIFRYDPAKRPTAEEVLAHPYFTSEEPSPQQPIELENIEGDWHEFESKALRKERDREARRAESQRDKRKTVLGTQDERDPKRIKQDTNEGPASTAPSVQQ